jgi:hypothetical protein
MSLPSKMMLNADSKEHKQVIFIPGKKAFVFTNAGGVLYLLNIS